MNLSACSKLARVPETGTWFRALDLSYLASALSTAHTKSSASRYSAGHLLPFSHQFPLLYVAADQLTAMYEYGAVFGDLDLKIIPNPYLSFAMLNVQVSLREIVDLTDVAGAQQPLDITAQELTGDWRGYQSRSMLISVTGPAGIAPTQELGAALAATGIEGFQSLSAKVASNRVLIVFPDNLLPGSYVSIRDSSGIEVLHIP